MNPCQLREMLALALKDHAPAAHKRMKAQGSLETYLDSLTGQIWESLDEATSLITDQAARRTPPFNNEATLVAKVNSARRIAEEEALNQAIEQIASLR